jgi:DNA-binding beta-propeller fold protein YncE
LVSKNFEVIIIREGGVYIILTNNNKKNQSNKLVKKFPARAIAAGFVAVRNPETRQTTKTENILSSFQDFTFLYE